MSSEGLTFDFLETVPENWVEIPNERRGGHSGVIKTRINNDDVYIKKQTGHFHRSLRHPLGRPTAHRECEAIVAMHQLGITVPDILFCASRKIDGKHRTYLVTRALEGYQPLDAFCLQHFDKLPAARQQQLLQKIASLIALFHRHRWKHTSLYAKHIFLREREDDFELALIDLENMRRMPGVRWASRHDIEQFSRHQPPGWEAGHWQQFLQFYQQALGTT